MIRYVLVGLCFELGPFRSRIHRRLTRCSRNGQDDRALIDELAITNCNRRCVQCRTRGRARGFARLGVIRADPRRGAFGRGLCLPALASRRCARAWRSKTAAS